MITLVQDLRLDINQQAPSSTDIVLTQGDAKANIFNARVFDGSLEIDYDAVGRAWIVFAKPDKTTVQGAMEDREDGGYTYTLGTNEVAAAGKVLCSILLYGEDNERLSTSRFWFTVQPDILNDNTVPSTTEYGVLIQLIKELEELISQGGAGDMTRMEYDTNNNGIVDKAESAPWSGITGKPETYPPGIHTHQAADVVTQEGLPVLAGGALGQVLKKASASDYDFVWGDAGGGIITGSYIGDNTNGRVINIGYKPSMLIVYADGATPIVTSGGETEVYFALATLHGSSKGLRLADEGFTVYNPSAMPPDNEMPRLNRSGITYCYLVAR